MGKIICICGKICSGKSTYADELCSKGRAVLLSVDEVMLSIFGLYAGEKHDEYTAGVQAYLLEKAAEIAGMGIDVVLDWGFWTTQSRKRVKEYFENKGIKSELHYIDIPDYLWEERIAKRNADITAGRVSAYIVDENLAAKFARIFEEPGSAEIAVRVQEE